MVCGGDDKLVKSCGRGDKNNRASDYGQKSLSFHALPFSFCSFSSRNSLSPEQEPINYGGKNLASSSGNQILAPRRRICSKTTELDSPLSLSLSLSLSSLIFMGSWFLRGGGRAEEGERRAVGREEGGEGNGGREAGGDLLQLQAIGSY